MGKGCLAELIWLFLNYDLVLFKVLAHYLVTSHFIDHYYNIFQSKYNPKYFVHEELFYYLLKKPYFSEFPLGVAARSLRDKQCCSSLPVEKQHWQLEVHSD